MDDDSNLKGALSAWSEEQDEAIALALETEDPSALAKAAELEPGEAEAILAALGETRPRLLARANEALDAFLEDAPEPAPPPLTLIPGGDEAGTPETPPSKKGSAWTRRLAVLAPAAAAAVLLLSVVDLGGGGELPEIPSFRVDALALGQRATKGPLEGSGVSGLRTPPGAPIVWREGITFHVRLTPSVPSAVPITAQAFLRSETAVTPLGLGVEERPDGVHVHGVIGVDVGVVQGEHELVLVVTPASHPVEVEDVRAWSRGAPSGSGRELFWYDVEVR